MANHGHQLCLARPRGESCRTSRKRKHPHMQELPECICFDCELPLMVRREAALLTAQGVPLISANSAWRKFQGLGFDYEHPDGSDLCALCTQPADGEPMLRLARRRSLQAQLARAMPRSGQRVSRRYRCAATGRCAPVLRRLAGPRSDRPKGPLARRAHPLPQRARQAGPAGAASGPAPALAAEGKWLRPSSSPCRAW